MKYGKQLPPSTGHWPLTTGHCLRLPVIVITFDDAADVFAGGGKLDAVEEFVARQANTLVLCRPALDVRRPGVVSRQGHGQGVRLVAVAVEEGAQVPAADVQT